SRPVGSGAVVLAQIGGAQLQQRFGAAVEPELFAALHATIDLLDRRLYRRAARRQSQAPVTRVIHPGAIVLNVDQRLPHDLPRVGVASVFGWLSQLDRRLPQTRQQRFDLSRPRPPYPLHVLLPGAGTIPLPALA